MNQPNEFWDELPDALADIDGMEDATAADTLIEFLELHRETWGAVVQSMAASAARRGMIERACDKSISLTVVPQTASAF